MATRLINISLALSGQTRNYALSAIEVFSRSCGQSEFGDRARVSIVEFGMSRVELGFLILKVASPLFFM